jgi:predicted nucleic acid-binding protein
MGISDEVEKHDRIMVDTAPIIYLIEENKYYSDVVEIIFKNFNNVIFSSVISLIEVLTKPIKNKRNDLVEKYTELLFNSEDFSIYPVDAVIAEKSAELRAKYNIRTPDAIQLAVGIVNNATLFITNDLELKKIKEIKVMVLKDYI